MMSTGKIHVYEEVRNDGADDYSAWQVRAPHGMLEGAFKVLATYDSEEEADAHVSGIVVARYGEGAIPGPRANPAKTAAKKPAKKTVKKAAKK